MSEIEEKVAELEKSVLTLSTTAKVIGVVAIIFGLAGGWGYKLISDARGQISALQHEIDNSEKKFKEIRVAQELEFEKIVSQRKSRLEGYIAKKETELREISGTWPPDSYCVLKKGDSCPSGFSSGFLHLDTEDDDGDNKWSGSLPNFNYQRNNIDMNFCCK